MLCLGVNAHDLTLEESKPVHPSGLSSKSSRGPLQPRLPPSSPRLVTNRNPAAGASKAASPGKTGVLFVCLGNICRSPTAEAMFRAVAEREGVADKFDIDSCGTGGGNPGW
jgi:hypothetical protein